MDMRQIIRDNPVLAIMRNVPTDKAVDYAQAIVNGGIKFFEVALNSKDALAQITLLRKHFGDAALIGAGTAVTPDLAKAAVDAGAMYLLAPSAPVGVLQWCAKNSVAFLPGVLTPTEVTLCVNHGFDTLKLFPAGDMPMSYVKSLRGPLDNTEYMAIGGVRPDNISDFLKAGYIGVGLGSNLMPAECAKAAQWDKAADFIRSMLAGIHK